MSPENVPFRLPRTARRTRLARLTAAGAMIVVPVACANNDAAVLDGGGSANPTVEGTVATTSPTSNGADTAATVAASSSTVSAPTPAPSGEAVADSAEMVVGFTYTAGESSRGPARNPYIAVWVEDTSGNLVQTVSLWFDQSQKGTRWLNELRSWYSASSGDVTSSGATRVAGAYTVAWDGSDVDGNRIAQGEYVLFVESAREHGPYSVTSAPIMVSDNGFTVTLPDNGELSGLTAAFTV